MQLFVCEQGSPEWLGARLGIPTASEFATVMAKGRDGGDSKTRRTYMMKLAGEILTGEPMEAYSNHHMERGKEYEPDARNLYAFMHDVELEQVGFIRNGQKGCSPDSLIGASGGLEIKTALPHIQVDRLLSGDCPSEHRAQVQGCIWIAEREWWDFASYWPRLPLFVTRIYRDDAYIAGLASAVDKFNAELAEMVERIRRMEGAGPDLKAQLTSSLEAA
ncbi:MAG TPA: YqaJ viral recombinase family protein [Nitrobacter sp.]|nr:YqaJ viral recombinase family protein [Nitrobacter sp.]